MWRTNVTAVMILQPVLHLRFSACGCWSFM